MPNWTGRLPITGWPLGGLALLWLAGRVTVMVSAGLPPLLVAAVDLAFPVVFALVILREIVAGRNWRNLIVLGMLATLIIGNALFHWEAAQGAHAAQGYGLRLGLGAGVMMIAVIGGRVVPSFTRNWLAKRGPGRLPVPPMQRFDKAALAALLVALLSWVAWPLHMATGVALALAGGLHLVRLARWAGQRTLAEPLVTVLHAGYGFVPLGALALAMEIVGPGSVGMAGAQHLWMAGAIGLMTLAIMTRATLGHTGQALTAGPGTVMIYAMLLAAVLARVAAGAWPGMSGRAAHGVGPLLDRGLCRVCRVLRRALAAFACGEACLRRQGDGRARPRCPLALRPLPRRCQLVGSSISGPGFANLSRSA